MDLLGRRSLIFDSTIASYQIAFDVDGTEERAALGRHGFERFGVRLPLVPFAIDVIVAAEDGAALVVGAAPRRSGMGGALCENE